MKPFSLTITVILLSIGNVFSQPYAVRGKVTDVNMEPLPYVTIRTHELKYGTVTKIDGTYELMLGAGKYEMIFSIMGYKTQVHTILVRNEENTLNVIMEEDEEYGKLSEVVVRARIVDRSEEIIRNVIRNKDAILAASGPYSCKIYIKAAQEDSFSVTKKNIFSKKSHTLVEDPDNELSRMTMSEIVLQYDHESDSRVKEKRIAVSERGNTDGLFFLTATDGNMNIYNTLMKAPALSEIPFLSPVSYSGMMAYRYKTLKTEFQGRRKIYTISVKPRQLSNTTVEGELKIMDSLWVVLEAKFTLPKYHLPEYDYFLVEQEYNYVDSTAWMLGRQKFTYYAKNSKLKKSGYTIAVYQDYQLNRQFDKRYFGVEVSSTDREAYKLDSNFWKMNRPDSLTEKEARFIQYKDSLQAIMSSKAYLDSVDREINKITFQNVIFFGQTFNNHEKEKRWYIPPATSLIQPFKFGGTRVNAAFYYKRTFESRKDITIDNSISYGFRNRDLNGWLKLIRMYNPKKRGHYFASLGRDFEYIFDGDSWINMLKRSNIYLNNWIGLGHETELVNGLLLVTEGEVALRRSVSHYKINQKVDSLFGDLLTNNLPIHFEPYNASYLKIRIEYTPRQKFIREPKEKIILGSQWPTFYAAWRKGIPDLFGSRINFDYFEFGLKQQIKVGIAGNTKYNIKTGRFTNQKVLRTIDYTFQREGDPFWFQNPEKTFQALDSTFPVFNRFYEGHFVHEFNGALLNKIPLMKKLKIMEVAGAGFLIAPERDLRYAEFFAGIEKVITWPSNPISKFKLGIYVVTSWANTFKNPVQFKIGLTTWHWRKNRWY
jgi:hypothetical protein